MLSKRIQLLSESATLAITTKAGEMRAAGKDVLSFSVGQPDFEAPEIIKKAAIEATNGDNAKYTAVAGTTEVLTAVQTKLKNDHGLEYDIKGITVNVGAKQSLFNLFSVLVDEGDEVIIPAPYWVTYPELVKYCGGKSVIIDTNIENDYKITADELKKAITPKTKILMLNSPSNPSGAVYDKDELIAIGEVLKGTDILVFSDEMYEKLMYDGEKFTATASISDDMYNRTITINGLSKSAAMPGWRFGYMATPNMEISKAVRKLQGQSTSNINSVTQKAAIPALMGEADDTLEDMRKIFEHRRNVAVDLLSKIDGFKVMKPKGAFYLFVDIKDITMNDEKFCLDLLEQKYVALVHGEAFGLKGHFRLSFATDEKSIREGIARIAEFVKELK